MKTELGRDMETVARGEPFTIDVDGIAFSAFEGETVAAVMLAVGRRTLRRTARFEMPRGVYCGMGTCFDCLMVVDGMPNVRACQTPARPGMKVETQTGHAPGRFDR